LSENQAPADGRRRGCDPAGLGRQAFSALFRGPADFPNPPARFQPIFSQWEYFPFRRAGGRIPAAAQTGAQRINRTLKEEGMRFRIRKNEDGSVYTIVVSGEMDDESGWDLLQVAQVMLAMPRCRELVVDLQAAIIDEEVTVFNSDTLVSVFEERMFTKDCTVVFRCADGNEICISSGREPLEMAPAFANVSLQEARRYGRALRWLAQEARMLAAASH
jgi:hypothetical protein